MVVSPCCKAEISLGPISGASICMDCGQPAFPTDVKRYTLTRDEALQDARRLRWRDVGDQPPTDAPYYAAWKLGGEWFVWRVPTREPLPPLASHWCLDALGTPLA